MQPVPKPNLGYAEKFFSFEFSVVSFREENPKTQAKKTEPGAPGRKEGHQRSDVSDQEAKKKG